MIKGSEAGAFPTPLIKNKKIKKEQTVSLPESRNHTLPDGIPAENISKEKRKSAGLAAFIKGYGKEGSLSLEAAAVVPLFLICILSLFSCFSIMCTQLLLQTAMETVGKEEASGIYARDVLINHPEAGESLPGMLVDSILLASASEQKVRDRLKEMNTSFADERIITDGEDGISFIGSGFYPEDQSIVIAASFRVKTLLIPGISFPVSQMSVHRAYTGKKEENLFHEPVVFITKTGTVYHTSLSCHYLKLSIMGISKNALPTSKNASGKPYRECEICGFNEEDTVYITSYGDCYHSNRNCSGLKRTILSIPLSQAGGRRKCKKCAARDGS